jgi:hypothetical protein
MIASPRSGWAGDALCRLDGKLKTFGGESDPKHPINFIAPGAPSAKPDHFSVGDVQSRMKGDGNSVASVVVRELRKNGANESTIAGVSVNISPVYCCGTFFYVQFSARSTLERIQFGQSAKTWCSSNELHWSRAGKASRRVRWEPFSATVAHGTVSLSKTRRSRIRGAGITVTWLET